MIYQNHELTFSIIKIGYFWCPSKFIESSSFKSPNRMNTITFPKGIPWDYLKIWFFFVILYLIMAEPLLAIKIVTILLVITLINAQKQLVSAQDASNFLTGTTRVITSDCYNVNACLNSGAGAFYTVAF